MVQTECYDDGRCYYVYKDAWHVWGRWLLLGLLVAVLIMMIPFTGYLMSRRRMRRGEPPVSGCAWMFSNPYKDANKIPPGDYEAQEARPQRYRPPNVYRQYQQERFQQEQYRTDSLSQSGPSSSNGAQVSSYYPEGSGTESLGTYGEKQHH